MIDFNKPIEVQQNGSTEWKPARVLVAVNYLNPLFTHAVAITHPNGSESVHAVRTNGYGEDGFQLRNTPPKVVKELWVNMYKDGSVSLPNSSKSLADSWAHERTFGYFVTKDFDDGSRTNEFIPVN